MLRKKNSAVNTAPSVHQLSRIRLYFGNEKFNVQASVRLPLYISIVLGFDDL